MPLLKERAFYMNRDKIKSVLLEAAMEAGALMKSKISSRGGFSEKSEISIVTETDLACEKLILSKILGTFPTHSILSEESPAKEGSHHRWIIDPIDGTTNFAHTFPASCVSIGYEEEGEPVMGAIYDPFRDEMFFAAKGAGAFLNGKRIFVSQVKTLSHSLLATGFPYDRKEKADIYLAMIKTFLLLTHDIRRVGAAALDLCYVACGRFDGYWEANIEAWDKAAGRLLVTEAGGRVSDYSGTPMTLAGRQNLATNGLIHDAMLKELEPFKNLSK